MVVSDSGVDIHVSLLVMGEAAVDTDGALSIMGVEIVVSSIGALAARTCGETGIGTFEPLSCRLLGRGRIP